ncbi:retrovirus-related pol polyprotein from transposon TNT 1-94, partial [Tanacetum coccineum]
MNELPIIVHITTKVNVFLTALHTQKKEQRLFQFLASQRSQVLLMSQLPSVESACALLQQEESQGGGGVFGSTSHSKTTALHNKSETKEKCSICGYKWHPEDKCWEKVGYPAWHYKSKQSQQKGKGKATNTSAPPKRTTAAVESGNVVFTSRQFEQLMKSLPHFNAQNFHKGGDSDEELDHHFAAGIYCFSIINGVIWILDTGCTDHMTHVSNDLTELRKLEFQQLISFTKWANFKYLSNWKSNFAKQSSSQRCFGCSFIQIQPIDLVTTKVLGLDKKQARLYHLLNFPLDQIHAQLSAMVFTALEDCSLYSFFSNYMPNKSAFSVFNNSYSLWHHRLGHVSNSTLKHITCVPHASKSHNDTCLSCPMAKFTKLPFSDSDSHCQIAFHMIHIDIWRPYKVPTLGQNRYFLTIVDDFSRGVWTYLLVHKSDAYYVRKSFVTFVHKQFEKEVKVI